MATQIFKYLSTNYVNLIQVRYKFSRGKPPGIARSLNQRLAEIRKNNAIEKVDIGFSLKNYISKDYKKAYRKIVKANSVNPELEKLSSTGKLLLSYRQVKNEWLITSAPMDIYKVADYYGIYDDLYKNGYFYPVVPLTIKYNEVKQSRKLLTPIVYRGNIIKSFFVKNAPKVEYTSEPDTLWTLLLTTPDGNFSDPNLEYCHWFIGNIPGSDIVNGEQIIDYLRPFPAHGIGYCRYIFVLYKQDEKIDFSEYKKTAPCVNLTDRNWKTFDFLRKHQDRLTPAGLAFFQCDYDTTLKRFYHNVLDMECPSFEYDFPKPYLRPQEWFPKRRPFNIYMDRYRDPKQINKEFLLRKLAKEHPFEFPTVLKFPNAHRFKGYVPSWLKLEIEKERLGLGRAKEFK